jgi:hypothetical protein
MARTGIRAQRDASERAQQGCVERHEQKRNGPLFAARRLNLRRSGAPAAFDVRPRLDPARGRLRLTSLHVALRHRHVQQSATDGSRVPVPAAEFNARAITQHVSQFVNENTLEASPVAVRRESIDATGTCGSPRRRPAKVRRRAAVEFGSCLRIRPPATWVTLQLSPSCPRVNGHESHHAGACNHGKARTNLAPEGRVPAWGGSCMRALSFGVFHVMFP